MCSSDLGGGASGSRAGGSARSVASGSGASRSANALRSGARATTTGPVATSSVSPSLAAPGTINTLPEKTLLAFADHGHVGPAMRADGGYADEVLEACRREGVDDEAMAARLQHEGLEAFATSWHALLNDLRDKQIQREPR